VGGVGLVLESLIVALAVLSLMTAGHRVLIVKAAADRPPTREEMSAP
jgi:hypothetical protein